jgi:hypothetical protein
MSEKGNFILWYEFLFLIKSYLFRIDSFCRGCTIRASQTQKSVLCEKNYRIRRWCPKKKRKKRQGNGGGNTKRGPKGQGVVWVFFQKEEKI